MLDKLTGRGETPCMAGVFVDPGMLDDDTRKNRNIENDAFDDRYATFLATEVIPEVERIVSLAFPAECREVCGGSSGGNAAFTAAWLRPNVFSKVIGFLSNFAQMPGGNHYPELINPSMRNGLRVFLQAGRRELNWNKPTENWLAENLRVAAALTESGYDFRLVLGDGAHSPNHCEVLLPDALRWVWRYFRA